MSNVAKYFAYLPTSVKAVIFILLQNIHVFLFLSKILVLYIHLFKFYDKTSLLLRDALV